SKYGEKWEIYFDLNDIEDEFLGLEYVKKVLHDFMTISFFHYNAVFDDIELDSYHITPRGNTTTHLNSTMYIRRNAGVVLIDGAKKKIEKHLNNQVFIKKLNSCVHFKLYYQIENNEDSIVRFMFLYSLIADLKGSQKQIDDYIKSVKFDVKEYRSTNPRYKGVVMETEYTWLRNQLSHTNCDSDLLQFEKDIVSIVDALSYIVKGAITDIYELNLVQ
ncbi:hypothetical protein, partial [Bacillus sp. JJ722]|uniref:hypothetical protein n=1 Tax=Bacillus sp. JJ722 TaxID=3122973 RepID=UPI002FFF15E0